MNQLLAEYLARTPADPHVGRRGIMHHLWRVGRPELQHLVHGVEPQTRVEPLESGLDEFDHVVVAAPLPAQAPPAGHAGNEVPLGLGLRLPLLLLVDGVLGG